MGVGVCGWVCVLLRIRENIKRRRKSSREKNYMSNTLIYVKINNAKMIGSSSSQAIC